jgi:hypothetical protein
LPAIKGLEVGVVGKGKRGNGG